MNKNIFPKEAVFNEYLQVREINSFYKDYIERVNKCRIMSKVIKILNRKKD